MSSFVNEMKSHKNPAEQASSSSNPADAASFFDNPVFLARLAYQIWERSGRPDQQEECWSQAEEELRRPRFLN